MKPFPVRIGVEELDTGSPVCSGYSFFCLPEPFVEEFCSATRALLARTKLSEFHAKDYKRRFADAYLKFLVLIVEAIKKSPQTFAACRLFSNHVHDELKKSCRHTVLETVPLLSDLRLPDSSTVTSNTDDGVAPTESLISKVEPYFIRLACLVALSRELAPNVEMRIEVDRHSSLIDLATTLGATPDAESVSQILRELYNHYARDLHARTPLLPEDGIVVVDSHASEMVQAADVLGNFAVAHMAVITGLKTTGRQAKADMITAALGDLIPAFDPKGKLVHAGNELHLAEEGSVTFKVGWRITKPPDDASLMANWPEDDGFLGKGVKQP